MYNHVAQTIVLGWGRTFYLLNQSDNVSKWFEKRIVLQFAQKFTEFYFTFMS